MSDEVYCSECRWLDVLDLRPDMLFVKCLYKDNDYSNWRYRKGVCKDPEEINRTNDCAWFEFK